MKKIIFLTIILLMIIASPKEKAKNQTTQEELRGVFVSYIELEKYIKNKTIEQSKTNIDNMIYNCKTMKLNLIVLQVRMASDAIYPSNIFPYSMYISKKEGEKTFDVLAYFLKKAHDNNIKLYAWINPYRVRTTDDISSISKNNPAYQYIGTDYLYQKQGVFYNPAKQEVTNLIVEGVKEVLNYKVDGILFDDYFYPSNDIDEKDYQEYHKTHDITKEEYHLEIISQMIKKVHDECQKKNIPFGVSPDGNIENNYQKHFADIKKWLENTQYIDFIIPQIYYGFYNSIKGFQETAKEWDNLVKKENIKLLIALAFYKVGKEDKYAKDGREEWIYNDNIIMREVILSRNLNHYNGFCLFRYDTLFNKEIYTTPSIEEI